MSRTPIDPKLIHRPPSEDQSQRSQRTLQMLAELVPAELVQRLVRANIDALEAEVQDDILFPEELFSELSTDHHSPFARSVVSDLRLMAGKTVAELRAMGASSDKDVEVASLQAEVEEVRWLIARIWLEVVKFASTAPSPLIELDDNLLPRISVESVNSKLLSIAASWKELIQVGLERSHSLSSAHLSLLYMAFIDAFKAQIESSEGRMDFPNGWTIQKIQTGWRVFFPQP